MKTDDKVFEEMKTNCLDYSGFLKAAIRFGDAEKIEEIADEMRRKLYDLSLRASHVKNTPKSP